MGWSPQIHADFLGLGVTWDGMRRLRVFRIRGYYPLRPAFPDRSPETTAKSRWLLPFRSPLLWESRLISVPPATEMFQFTGFALPSL